jgi:RHS repeat-associated protein
MLKKLLPNPTACRYEALGRLLWACGDPTTPGVLLGYDGNNVVRTGPDNQSSRWTFIHGPGTDDPLIGHYHNSGSGDHEYVWYVTDGRGRQYAMGDSIGIGLDGTTGGIYASAKLAGGVSNSHTFGASRNGGNPSLPGLSFFRNRFYDQASGRWLQEDPIGLAGGMNLYQYVGNNPATYTDPFGLCPWCVAWGLFEVGATLYDLGDLAVTGVQYLRGRASGADLSITAAGVGAGIFGFGGGYGRAGRAALTRYGDEVFAMAQSGGRHSGFLANYAGRSAGEIGRAQRSLGRHIGRHEGYLADPTSKVSNFYELSQNHQQRLIEGWLTEIRDASDQIEILTRIR